MSREENRLPSDVYPTDMGPYQNPLNPDMNCMCCGTPEGAEHHPRLCSLRGTHVSLMRHAFECVYRLRQRREEAILKVILGDEVDEPTFIEKPAQSQK